MTTLQAPETTTDSQNAERAAAIAKLNDEARAGILDGTSKVLISSGLSYVHSSLQFEALRLTARFKDFSEDNNPWGERDFGSFYVGTEGTADYHHIFWKIDYYDPTMTKGSEDPADPAQTARLITIMLAEDY